ncbi:MAG: S-layer homology domain-containing protein [Clostridia bacterium]|nr:S-layer homology domain-containing protein [Clostridia bacterium]
MKKKLSALLALIMTAAAVAIALPVSADTAFSDVTPDMWSYDSISYAVDAGYMQGVGGGRFDPEGPLTRAMVATVLWRREGSPAPAAPSGFEDVPAGEWYSDAVAWAKETGVVNGTTEKTFEPDAFITREQLGTMLFRFSSSAPVSVPERADLSPFADDEKVSDWAQEPLEWAVQAGLLKGTDGNRLDPGGFAMREQFAAIIERYDGSFKLAYNRPLTVSRYSEKEYPLVTDADFYVSTEGSDENDGSFDHPFRTFGKAVSAVRDLKKTKRDDITVAFMAGYYGPLSVSMTAEDSGSETQRITYCKYGDGDVVFSGGFDVTPSEFTELDESEKQFFPAKAADKIRKADISDRLVSYDPENLLVLGNSGEMILARTPNKFPDGTDDLYPGMGYTTDSNHIRIDSSFLKRKIASYHKPEELYLYGYLTTGWYKDTLETDGYTVDPETGHFDFHIVHPERARMGHLRYLELDGFDSAFWNKTALINASEELDGAGEYWIDADTKTFYVFDPSGEYHFTGGGDMITADKACYVTFKGLDFKNSAGHMINAGGHPRGMTIEGCKFVGCSAGTMVSVSGGTKSVPLDVTVTGCEFSNCASTALYIGGLNANDLFGSGTGVLVDNNLFTLTCLRDGNNGALRIRLPFATVSHNEFKKCYWEGIDFRSCLNMTAEYNVFDQVCYNGDDTGAINNWNSVDRCGNVVRYNLFIDISGGTNGRFSLYLDDTAGTQVYSNVFYEVDATAKNNGISKYNEFRDNLIINPGSRGATGCEPSTDATRRTEGAMAAGDIAALTSDEYYVRWKAAFDFFDSHPDAKAKAEELWPGYFDISLDPDDWQKPEFCMNSSLVITNNVDINKTGEAIEYGETISKYSVIEDNAAYSVNENPFFVNPTLGDYRLVEGSGFPDYHFEHIGRY